MKRFLLLTLPLVLVACPKAEQASGTPSSPPAATVQPPSNVPAPLNLDDTLIAAARTQPLTSEMQVCFFLPFKEAGASAITRYLYNQKPFYARAVEAGYFTTEDGPPFQLLLTPKYTALLVNDRSTNAYAPKVCAGTARLTSLSSVRQLGPDKVTARGVMTLEPQPWATDEVLDLFNGGKVASARRELSLIFRKVGDTWRAERF